MLTLLGQTEKQVLIGAPMPVYWGDYQCVCAWTFVPSQGTDLFTKDKFKSCVCMPNCFHRVRLCDPGLALQVHGILQARILDWFAMTSSRGSFWPRIEPKSLMSPALADRFFTISTTWKAPLNLVQITSEDISFLSAISQSGYWNLIVDDNAIQALTSKVTYSLMWIRFLSPWNCHFSWNLSETCCLDI